MSWFSSKNIIVLAALGWTLYNLYFSLQFKPVFFGLFQWPVIDWNYVWGAFLGLVALYIGVFRMEPRGRFLGSGVE